jgi:trk system potassium uptake protein TrkA
MYAIVVGMGMVGRHVVGALASEQHEVVAVDRDAEALAIIEERHDVATLQGYGANLRLLQEAGAAEADLVVGVTDDDEVNLVAGIAGKHLGARRAVARLQGSEFEDREEGVYQGLLGIDVVVNPRILVASEIAKVARSHGALDVIGLAGNRLELVQLELPAHSKMLHKPLAQLAMPRPSLVAAVVRDGELFVPGGGDVLLPGDRCYLIGHAGRMQKLEDLFCGGHEAAKVFVVGGGEIGLATCRMMAASGLDVVLLEKDRTTAERLAVGLPRVTVLHGDGTDLTLLEEEQVGDFDLFCALTHDDEANLMSGLLAKRVGAERTLCLVQRSDYMDIYRQLGIDVVMSPRRVASDHILRYARATELQSLTVLEGGQAEVLEFDARPESRVVGKPLKRLEFPRGAIIAAIVDSEGVRVPSGDDVVNAGSTVVVLTTSGVRTGVERLFRGRAL